MPPIIHIRAENGRAVPWLDQTLQFVACEATAGRPGASIVIAHLSHVFFIQIVRAYLASAADGGAGWLRALADPLIKPALDLMHQQPEAAWTVAALADRVGLSRSTFSARFTDAVGEPPLQYLTRWRMQKAASFLRAGDRSVADVATRVGYEAEAAFSKAFKRQLGVAPGAYRRGERQANGQVGLAAV
ncbi:MAG: AraC family transcriptional regulator [Candidatus Sericytochromatia bacterium]|nr:AraC family transcriptional regulator [Candidatus Sericytochromatia bacterium]